MIEKVIKRAETELEYAKTYDCYAMLDKTTLELLLFYIKELRVNK